MKIKKLFDFKCGDMYLHHTLTQNPDCEDFSFKSHSHNMAEVYYFLRGKARFAVDGNVYDLRRGNVVVMGCGQTHNLLLESCTAYERIALLIDAASLPVEFSFLEQQLSAGKNFFELSAKEQIWFEQNIGIIKSAKEESRRDLTIGFAATLFSFLSSKLQTSEFDDKTEQSPIVKQVVSYVNRHLAEELSLDIICRALYTNKVSLNRKFSAIMGCSIWEYVLRRRIFAARQRLYISGSITEAYENSGFKDYTTFWRAYKKYVGVSPSVDLKKAK